MKMGSRLFKKYLFIYLCRVLVEAHGMLCESWGIFCSGAEGSVGEACGLSCPETRVILVPSQGSNPKNFPALAGGFLTAGDCE